MFHPHAILALHNPPFFSFILLLTHTISMYEGGRRKRKEEGKKEEGKGRRKGKEGGKKEEGKGRRDSCMPSPLAPDPIRVQSCVCCLF